jgi:hypothetical protein
MGCLFRSLFRLILLGAIIFVLVVVFLPKFLAQAGNSILSNVDSSANPISGLAQLIPANFFNKNNQLQISLSGLEANKKYEVTLDPGQCGNSGYIDVGIVTSDGSGNVNTTFTVTSFQENNQVWYVDVHSTTDPTAASIACNQLNTNGSSTAADATNTALQLSPVPTNTDLTNSQSSSSTSSPSSPPKGFPDTGVAPGGSNGYDNNVYPRKF